MTWGTVYSGLVSYLETALGGVSGVSVYTGTPPLALNFPCAVINPSAVRMRILDYDAYRAEAGFDVMVFVRDVNPSDWVSEVCSVLNSCLDAIIADRTMGGNAQDIHEADYVPGEIRFSSKIFYGGVLRIRCWLRYEP